MAPVGLRGVVGSLSEADYVQPTRNAFAILGILLSMIFVLLAPILLILFFREDIVNFFAPDSPRLTPHPAYELLFLNSSLNHESDSDRFGGDHSDASDFSEYESQQQVQYILVEEYALTVTFM